MKLGQIVAVAVVLGIAATAVYAQAGLDVSVSGAGVFSKTTNSATTTISDSPTKSLAEFGTVRYHLNKHHAVEFNIGHTSNSQIFTVSPDTYRVTTGITEFTGAYVFTPFRSKRLQPFLLAGGGGLKFSVDKTYIDSLQISLGAKPRTPLALLYGIGTDYTVWSHLGIRVQYRGLIYKNPDYGVPSRFYTGAWGHMAEPAAGIVVKF
jgi:opacity protein-like surface antigen